jgi:hypothetical protein
MKIPARFDQKFLEWLRLRTERAWQKNRMRDPLLGTLVDVSPWQKDTRWLGGASEAAVRRMEERWQVSFPEDYRLFLKTLFTTDRPLLVQRYGKTNRPHLKKEPSFYNGLKDIKEINRAHDNLLAGLVFDVEHNGLWLAGWGKRPGRVDLRQDRVAALVKKAPRLIPIFGHRFLLAEPCRSGNPVFSIHQSDIICYGSDLRRYLLTELANLIGIDEEESYWASFKELKQPLRDIPFWGELYENNARK